MINSRNVGTVRACLTVANVLLGSLIVAFAAAFLYVQTREEPSFNPQIANRYQKVAQARLAERSDEIMQEAADLAGETALPLAQEVLEQAEGEYYSRYVSVLSQESDQFLADVEKTLVSKVQDQYRTFLRSHKEVIKSVFPQQASDENVEKLLTEFERTFDELAERYYVDEFRTQAERTATLWKQVDPAPQPGPEEPSLHEQLADYSADWVVINASTSPLSTRATPPLQSAPATDTPAPSRSIE